MRPLRIAFFSFGLLTIASASRLSAQGPAEKASALSFGGYVETLYSYNFNEPSNGLTNFRGFDNRHNTFTLSNLVLDANGQKGAVSAKVTLQAGHTPNTYYLSEPALAGSSGASSSDATLWRYVQQAYVGYKAPIGKGLQLQGGLFLSPIGHENMPVKDNWNWSRSNLFFGLPFYHTGVRATYDVNDRVSATLAVTNGWNSIADNNGGKSVYGQVTVKGPHNLSASVLYFGGPERPRGAHEGQPWRHLLDAWALVDLTPAVSVAIHGDVGGERNAFGTSSWAATALYGRVKLSPWLYTAVRADAFWERVPEKALGRASAIFFPARRVLSGTATLEVRVADSLSLRLELRRDQASSEIFFRDDVVGDGSNESPFLPNARTQTTVTLGAVAWF